MTGSAHSRGPVANGDGDAGSDGLEIDDEAAADCDGLAEGDAVSMAVEVGVADSALLSLVGDPVGGGVADADGVVAEVGAASESAGSAGASEAGSAVTSAVEGVSDGNGASEPTRGPTDGSIASVDDEGPGSALGVALGVRVEVALGVAIWVAAGVTD